MKFRVEPLVNIVGSNADVDLIFQTKIYESFSKGQFLSVPKNLSESYSSYRTIHGGGVFTLG